MGTSDEQIAAMAASLKWARDWQEGGRFTEEQRQHEVALAACEIVALT
jgi:hypothetical protein